MNKAPHHKLVHKVVSRRAANKSVIAFQAYDAYKEITDIIDRVDIASGKGLSFKSDATSTLNFEINPYGARSTTTQEI